MLGVVWPDYHVAFPDFLDPANKTQQWWTDEFTRLHNSVPFVHLTGYFNSRLLIGEV